MERAIDPLLTIDAKLWADEFMATKQRLGDAEFDRAMMLSWFANAIMRGYDAGRDSMTPTPPSPDSQATIAALEETILKMGENAAVVAKDAMAAKEQVAALQARVQELEAQHEDLVERNRILRHRPDLPVERTEFHDRFVKLQSQLTQRTAELEAVKADTKNMLDVATRRLHEQVNDLQAELEHVRAQIKAYADAKTDFDDKRLQEDHHSWKERYNKLVEAENALLQHRQGMEG